MGLVPTICISGIFDFRFPRDMTITLTEVREHASAKSCWVIIKGNAYDLTNFLDSHPGGSRVILKYAGQDATEAFEPIHPGDTLEKYLLPHQHIGPVMASLSPVEEDALRKRREEQVAVIAKQKRMRLRSIINIRDFEGAASEFMTPASFAFVKAAGDDEYTAQWNIQSWRAIRFRPRILRPIENVSLSITIFGTTFSAPFFICPAGGGKLAHPDGEVLMTKAAAKHDVLHWVCNMASCTQQEMADARGSNQTQYWQIYAMNDLSVTEGEIKRAVELGYKGFALTVDAIRAGKRERDMRAAISEVRDTEEDDETLPGGHSAKRGAIWPSFDFPSAVKWLRNLTDLPIAIKGIQSWEDAALCMQHGVHPWLSNHGGRQVDGAPSAVETMIEIHQHCPEVFDRCEVIVDGGVTRGTDIVKALALGAKGVGLGRGFLYSLIFGEAGVSKAISILKSEVETTMALLGVTRIDQLNLKYVKALGGELTLIPRPHL